MGYSYLAKLMEKMASDREFMNYARVLNSYGKNKPEYKTTYDKLNSIYVTKYHKSGQNMTVHKTNEQEIFNYESNADAVAGLQRKPFVELQIAMRHHTGNKIKSFDDEEKKRFSPKVQKLLMSGFGLDERVGFASGVREKYIAKVYHTGKFPKYDTVIIRLAEGNQ